MDALTDIDDIDRRVRAALDAERERRRLEWRERLRTAGPWVAVLGTLTSPLVTYLLMR